MSEEDELENFRGRLSWQDTFVREKLTLFWNGYVYHPRFLVYHLEVAGALKQEQFEASYLPPQDQRNGSGLEYDGRVVLLPAHSSNRELFARRRTRSSATRRFHSRRARNSTSTRRCSIS